MPPWEAVDTLGRLASQEDGRLRPLWEAAATGVARQSAPGGTGPLARDGEAAPYLRRLVRPSVRGTG